MLRYYTNTKATSQHNTYSVRIEISILKNKAGISHVKALNVNSNARRVHLVQVRFRHMRNDEWNMAKKSLTKTKCTDMTRDMSTHHMNNK